MSASSHTSNDSSWGRRKSLLALSALRRSNNDDSAASKLRKKSKQSPEPNPFTTTDPPNVAQDSSADRQHSPSIDAQRRGRPTLTLRSSKRPSSVFDSLRLTSRASHDGSTQDFGSDEPLSAVSTTAPSFFGDAGMDGATSAPRTVLLHGEIQTSASMFRKKKEYLVLTETHILRYKSQIKASEAWKAVPSPLGKPPHIKHGSMTSVSSQSDIQTVSESSGDKDGRISLRQVVAVQRVDDGKPYFAIEVAYLDEEAGNSSALTLQLSNPEERDAWLRRIRTASTEARLRQQRYMSAFNVEHAARIVERDHDYDPQTCAVYKITQRQTPTKLGRSSSDDITKVACTVCLLAIGVHKVHIIQLAKAPGRASPSLTQTTSQASYGILAMTAIRVSPLDDSIELTFRQPLQKARQLYLASSASHEIAARLHAAESLLRPECGHRLFRFDVPREVEPLLSPSAVSEEEHSGLDRTIGAYCISYGLNPSNVRYTINYDCADAPRFELLPSAETRRPDYGPIALLAIMRALRYNETFGSLSFAGVSLDSLNGLSDAYGREYVCSRTKRGTPLRLSPGELEQSCLLVQEVRALAATSKRLRRMDFSNCLTEKTASTPSMDPLEEEPSRIKDIGCGVVEALVPLCRQQTTNVDWLCLNGIQLSETDMDYLVGAAVDKSCHFRAIELNRCGLNDRSMSLILDALRAQDNTIEAIEIGGNTARLNPATFDSQLSIFGFVHKLNLSYVPLTSGNEPLLTAETLLVWRLQELRFSGTVLNQASIDAVATYLAHPQSTTLHELYFDNAYLSGADVATLLHSMSHDPGHPRDLHLDISQNRLTKDLEQVTQAIAEGLTPSHLSMRAIEYREEPLFRKMLAALTTNKTIRYLDMSQTALPGDASEETCKVLCKLLAENDTLIEFDLSGEDSRLASSKFGPGINDALVGLKKNKTLQSFRIEKQRLGLQGASTLAEVLKDNTALRELHCDNNEIPLHGLTDLVNSLIENTTLIYLPSMDDGRRAAFRSAERTMKAMSDLEPPASPSSHSSRSPTFASSAAGVRRGIASVRRSAARTASAYAPSFPALPTRSSSSADTRSSTLFPPTFTTTPAARANRPSPSRLSFSSSSSTVSTSATTAGGSSAAPISFSLQDIQTTHRLLTEQWDRQVYRLQQYLDRNWCVLNAIPVGMEVEDEKFERPETASKAIENGAPNGISLPRVAVGGDRTSKTGGEHTPRAEREMYFDYIPPSSEERAQDATEESKLGKSSNLTVKSFLLAGQSPSSGESDEDDEEEDETTRLDGDGTHGFGLGLDGLEAKANNNKKAEEPRTPTQSAFEVRL